MDSKMVLHVCRESTEFILPDKPLRDKLISGGWSSISMGKFRSITVRCNPLLAHKVGKEFLELVQL